MRAPLEPTWHPLGVSSRVTSSVSVPATPAVNVIWLVPWPAVIVPFVIVQAYVLPMLFGTLAVRFGDPAPTVEGAVMPGAAGTGLTVTVIGALGSLTQPPAFATATE